MDVAYLLSFLAGLALGLILVLLFCAGSSRTELRTTTGTTGSLDPTLQSAPCVNGVITVSGSAPLTIGDLTRTGLYSTTVATLPSNLPHSSTGMTPQTGFPFNCAGNPSTGWVIVVTEYQGYGASAIAYNCQGSGSNMRSKPHSFAPTVSADLEVIPQNMRIEPGAVPPGASTGPAAELVGALTHSPEPVLRYVAEASTPAEPLWRALGGRGPVFEATLVLLHRTGGVGAVLTVVTAVGGQRIQFSWVTSNWRFNGANRLRCESDEPGLPVLTVTPA